MNTDKLTLFFLISLSWISCSGPQNNHGGYQINGTISGLEEGYVYLENSEEHVTIDSARVTDGKFSFTGEVKVPEIYYIRVNESKKHIKLFLENSNILIDSHIDSLYKAHIRGSKCQIELDSFYSQLSPYKQKLKALYKSYYKAEKIDDEKKMQEIDSEYAKVHNQQINHMKDYALSNPASVVAE